MSKTISFLFADQTLRESCCREMASDCITYEGIPFRQAIASPPSSKRLILLANGLHDTEIHFLQIKFYAIGLYAEPEVSEYLRGSWTGKSKDDFLADDSGFFTAFCKAPVEKIIKFVIIKEVKGSQFYGPIQTAVRDRLAAVDLFEDEEEAELDKLEEYFQKKAWMNKDTTIYFHWPSSSSLQVTFATDATAELPSSFEHTVSNKHVAEQILKWFCADGASVSPSVLSSLASNVHPLL